MWPFSGRCVAKDGYIEVLHKFVSHCTDLKYYVLKVHDLVYILNLKYR